MWKLWKTIYNRRNVRSKYSTSITSITRITFFWTATTFKPRLQNGGEFVVQTVECNHHLQWLESCFARGPDFCAGNLRSASSTAADSASWVLAAALLQCTARRNSYIFPNCKLSFFKLQSVFSANSASWDFGRRSALQGTPLISAECALHCTSGGLWRWAAILQVGLLQAAPLTVKRRSPFKALWLTTQPLSLVLMRYHL